ncbi:core component of ECF transporter [Shewanella avicenniae]|uniref:Core component of ECF transporter n=1 Tax=Shewanella avicenniae TaxID=2814294 RepID=A0ABX7QWV0_9GAMM|nr:core component of ECF transporter [Shewanella avicenniae]
MQDALFIGFCATLLVALKSILRLRLGLSGHSMLLMSFFYLICYCTVARIGAITACGAMAGAVAAVIGVGKGGPFLFIKFLAPAIAMELTLIIVQSLLTLRWRLIVVAVVGSIAWSAKGLLEDLLVGMSWQVALVRFGTKVAAGGLFAAIGALLVIPVMKRLKAHDLLYRNSKLDQEF